MLYKILQKTTYISFLFLTSIQLNAQSDHWETIVYDNSNWSYIVPGASTPANWIDPSFDASSWNVGAGGFGFGDGDDNTVTPTSSLSVYHRISFNVIDLSLITKLILNMDYDDGFVAYLNG